MRNLLVCTVILAFGLSARANLNGFRLSHCHEGSCFELSGAKAYASRDGGSLSGSNMTLKIVGADHKMAAEIHNCNSAQFDFKSKFLVCDNSGHGRPSLTLNSKFAIQTFNF